MNCYTHSLSSANHFGGKWEDYIEIHKWFDESKAHMADFRHRALRHHTFGIWQSESVFGTIITNSAGTVVPIRLIGERHVMEDLGKIPSVEEWLKNINAQEWMTKGFIKIGK